LLPTLLLVGSAPAARAQSARISGTSSLQYVQLRPLMADSVPVEEATGEGLIRRTAAGYLVRCVEGDRFCRFTRSDARTAVMPVIQDITVNAWGLGQGVRVQAQLRTRAAVGGHARLWPMADDAFDALTAFVELDRPLFRVRGGRQWKISGLGYYNFDGASALYRARPGLTLEAYGGWSLARGLNEPRTSASLAAIEPFAPDKRGLLLGTQISYRHAGLGVAALYQREIRSDRLGLYTERVAADATWRWNRGSLTGTFEADLGAGVVNDARLAANLAVGGGVQARAFARHYQPFFELWTIWGAFAPVGFSEGGLGVASRPVGRPFEVDVEVARRTYDETGASTAFGTFRDDGWTAFANGSWRLDRDWLAQGDYRIDFGFGAARSEAGLRLQHDLGEATYLGANLIGFERQFEFRVARGSVLGAGLDGRMRIGPRSRLTGSLMAYRHRGLGGAPDVDWSQFRGMLQFEWTLGPEPGLSRTAAGGR
jgi:hypothetical protein